MLRKLKFWFRYDNPFGQIERWIAYRTYDKYHVINIPTLKKRYYDKDTILMHGMFAVLTDFVEVELASWRIYDEVQKYSFFKKLWWRITHFCTKTYSKKHGLEALESFEEHQKEEPEEHKWAKEAKELYLWWTESRPLRKSPEELAGLTNFYDEFGGRFHFFVPTNDGTDNFRMESRLTAEQDELYGQLILESMRFEELQDEEDNEMLHRLVELRPYLWT